MSIKGMGNDWYVGKQKSTLISSWGKRIDFNYEDLESITYFYPDGMKPGIVSFNKKSHNTIEFKFRQKAADPVYRAMKLIEENNPDLKVEEIQGIEDIDLDLEYDDGSKKHKGYDDSSGQFSTWKLVSGITCIILFIFVIFQSCAAGVSNAIEGNGEISGSGGAIVAFMMLVGGIVSISTRKSKGNGGNIALIIIFGIGALTGFSLAGSFGDLNVWATWCLINALLALVSLIKKRGAGNALGWGIPCAIAVFVIMISALGNKQDGLKTSEPEQMQNKKEEMQISEDDVVLETAEKTEEVDDTSEGEVTTTFYTGDVFESDTVKIMYLDCGDYTTDNEFLQPKDGYKYIFLDFSITNMGDSDLSVGSYDFDCYADDTAVSQEYIAGGDDSLTSIVTLSPGKVAKGKVYFEVPVDASKIEIEYETDFWTEDKIYFIFE